MIPSVYMLIYIYVRLIFDIYEMNTVGFDVRNMWIAYLCCKIWNIPNASRPETHHGAFMVVQHGLVVMRK